MRLLPLALLVACDKEPVDSGACPDGPATTGVSPPQVLVNADSCGTWALAPGEGAVLDLSLGAAEVPCTHTLSGVAGLSNDPIYSNFGDSGPKRTYAIVVGEAGEGSLEVTCDDGLIWMGWFLVE